MGFQIREEIGKVLKKQEKETERCEWSNKGALYLS